MDIESQLSRRERQIMNIIYARGEASSAEILEDLPDPPARGAMRVMLRILEDKGHLTHHKLGRAYVYSPTVSRQKAGSSSLRRVVNTFFEGSIHNAVASHLAQKDADLSDEELRRLAELIRQARKKGR